MTFDQYARPRRSESSPDIAGRDQVEVLRAEIQIWRAESFCYQPDEFVHRFATITDREEMSSSKVRSKMWSLVPGWATWLTNHNASAQKGCRDVPRQRW